MNINKNEIITAMASKSGMTKIDTEKTLKAFVDVVTESLINGDRVQLVGFGTFETRIRAARKGKNPKTGEEIDIAESKSPAFKAGKGFKDAVNV